ncbi:MAG: class I SAM-dependent methyltransferase [Mycobacteriales bacterium]
MTAPVAALRHRLARELRNVPPGRRQRQQVALDAIESHTAGRDEVRLLDAGSEEGLLCLELARRHPTWQLIAADIAAEPLRRGREWAQAEQLPMHHVRCDLQLPVCESKYDVAVALESLVEIPDDRAAMGSIAVALRPGGLFIAQVPTADWTPVLRGSERSWRREARHGYETAEVTTLLDELGLDVQSVRPTFRRTVALAQDVRDRCKRRGRLAQLALLPLMITAVAAERSGLTWGPARALFVVAVKR